MKKLLICFLTVLLLSAALAVPSLAAETAYVYDWAEVLSGSEVDSLSTAAESISQTHGVGVYIATLPDMRNYGYYDIEACAEAFFNDMGLGLGSERTGILLILSMAERDYDIDAHGSFAHYAFTDYGKTTISDEFLDNFRRNDWYGGFCDYLSRCEDMLILAEDGNPVDITVSERLSQGLTPGGLAATAVLSLLIAWGVCALLKGRMTSAKLATDADSYVRSDAQITYRDDRFINATQTRRRIERADSGGRGGGGGGGTTISGGGHSHSSGKF